MSRLINLTSVRAVCPKCKAVNTITNWSDGYERWWACSDGHIVKPSQLTRPLTASDVTITRFPN